MSEYKVALEIIAAGNVEQFLQSIAGKLLGIHTKTEEIGKSLGNWGKLIGGAGLAVAGLEMLKFTDHIARAGGELQRQANIFQSAGNSMADTSAAIKGAFAAIQKVPGVDAVDAMKRLRELSGATQDNQGSIAILPDFLRAQTVYGAVTGQDPEEGMKRIAKMIELRQGAIDHLTHKIDPTKFAKELDVAVKALQVGQGLITANDLQMLVKQAGPMAKGMDPMKFWSIYLASLEDMGGARTGTAMTAVARQVLGGIMTPKVADEWEKLGLLNAPGQGWQMKKGHVDITDPGKAIRGHDVFRDEGFQAFIEKFVRPALQNAGFKTDNEINAEMYKLGSTETARRIYSMYLTGSEQVELEQEKIKKALGLDAYDSVFKGHDYDLGMKALTESIRSLEEALGGPAGEAIGNLALDLAGPINSLAAFAEAHKGIVQVGTYAAIAAGSLSVFAGTIISVAAAARIGGWALKGGTPPVPPADAAAKGAKSASIFDEAIDVLKKGAPELKPNIGGALKAGIKGGVVGGILTYFAEKALDEFFPVSEAAKKAGNVGSFSWMWEQLQKQFESPADGRFGRGVPESLRSPLKLVPPGFEGERVQDAFARARYSPIEARGDASRESSRAAALSNFKPATVNATLQAQVSTTPTIIVNVDGHAVANAIYPAIMQLVHREMALVGGMLMGRTNEIADYHSAGVGHN